MGTVAIPSAVGETTLIRIKEALARLARLEAPHTPVFHESGIVDAGIGYYQLARLGNRLLLRFAFNLEDMQQKEYPGQGKLFAHPGAFCEVGSYEENTPTAQIHADLIAHQAKVMQAMREGYTLVRIGPDLYCSLSAGYALQHHAQAAENGVVKDKVSIIAIFNSLHDKGYTPATVKNDGPLYDRLRVSRVPIGDEHVEPEKAVYTILDHFTRHLGKLMRGEEGLDGDDIKLNAGMRVALRSRMYAVRLLDKFAGWAHGKTNELKKQPLGLLEFAARAKAVAELLDPEKDAIKFIFSLREAFSFEPKEKEDLIPESLRPFVSHIARLPGTLGAVMFPTNATATEFAVPLTMEEAGIAPMDAEILPGSPFDVTQARAPDMGALRAPMGTILHAYADTTLLMQANGVWMAMQHKTSKLYVGYNANMDTDTKPNPSPILKAWLDAGKVLCYSCNCRGRACKPVSMAWEDATKDLREIIACGEGHLLATDAPKHDAGPHVIPGHAPLEIPYLDFSGAFADYAKKQARFGGEIVAPAPALVPALAPAAAALTKPAAPAGEQPHLVLVKFPPRPAQAGKPGMQLAAPPARPETLRAA